MLRRVVASATRSGLFAQPVRFGSGAGFGGVSVVNAMSDVFPRDRHDGVLAAERAARREAERAIAAASQSSPIASAPKDLPAQTTSPAKNIHESGEEFARFCSMNG